MGKKIVALSVLLASLCAVRTAEGIPYTGSITYEFEGEGGRILSGTIDFGVFDREVDTFAYTPPGEGRYIYAYQIKNDEGSLQEAVGYFAILLGGAPFDDLGSDVHENDMEALEPSAEYFLEETGNIVFEFKSEPEEGSLLGDDNLEPGMHSYILMYTSDNDWVAGSFQIKGGDIGDYNPPSPIPDQVTSESAPEPATILILGMGAGTALLVKRKS
jgi:hypothetical protein